MRAASRLSAALTTATVALCGCAGSLPHAGAGSHAAAMPAGIVMAGDIPASSVQVIRAWSNALRSGHVAQAAAYFHLPSIFYSGSGPPLELDTRGQVESINAALPCGARLLSVHRLGPYLNALFRLTNRPGPGGGQGCGTGLGETARTDFIIRDGLILVWLRAPDEPGDNGTPRTPTTPEPPQPAPAEPLVPTQPATPTTPAPPTVTQPSGVTI